MFPISVCLQGTSEGVDPVIAGLNDTLVRAVVSGHLKLEVSIGCPSIVDLEGELDLSFLSGPSDVNMEWNGNTIEGSSTGYSVFVGLDFQAVEREMFVRGRELIVKIPPNGAYNLSFLLTSSPFELTFLPLEDSILGDVDTSDAVMNVLLSLIDPYSPSAKAQYSPRYRLAFSLLNEDSSSSSSDDVGSNGVAMAWKIEAALARERPSFFDNLFLTKYCCRISAIFVTRSVGYS